MMNRRSFLQSAAALATAIACTGPKLLGEAQRGIQGATSRWIWWDEPPPPEDAILGDSIVLASHVEGGALVWEIAGRQAPEFTGRTLEGGGGKGLWHELADDGKAVT